MAMSFETTRPAWYTYLFFPITLFFSVSVQALVELGFGDLKLTDVIIVVLSALLCCSFIWGMITFLSNFDLFSFNYKTRQIRNAAWFVLFNAILFAGLNFAAVTLIIGKSFTTEIIPGLLTAIIITPWLYYYGKRRLISRSLL